MNQSKEWINEFQKDITIPELVNRRIDMTLENLPEETGKNNIRKHFHYSRAVIAAAVLLICGLFFTSNREALAKLPLIGHIFGQVETQTDFAIKQEDAKSLTKKDGILSAADQNVRVTASEVYSDGFSVFITFQITSEKYDFTKIKPGTDEQTVLSAIAYTGINKAIGKSDTDLPIFGKAINTHTFAGIARFDKTAFSYDDGIVNIRLSEFMPYEENNKEIKITGTWDLKVPFSTDRKGQKEIETNKTFHAKDKNDKTSDFMIKKIFVSKYQVVICSRHIKYPNRMASMTVFDQNGKSLIFNHSWGDDKNNYNCTSFLTSGSDVKKLDIFTLAETGDTDNLSADDFMKFVEAKSIEEAKKYADFKFTAKIK